jgi:hypothetical protein
MDSGIQELRDSGIEGLRDLGIYALGPTESRIVNFVAIAY